MPGQLNVGDAVEEMAKCMTRAALCAITLDVTPRKDEVSDEVIERARLEESGLIEMANELATLAVTFEEANMMPIFTDQDPGRVLNYWVTYLDQVVQYAAMYKQWEDDMLVVTPNAISTWIHLWHEPLVQLRAEVAHLVRNRAEQPIYMPAGRIPQNYGIKTA